MDVGRFVIPGEEFTLWSFKLVPSLISSHGVIIIVLEKLWLDDVVDNLLNFVSSWPDVS